MVKYTQKGNLNRLYLTSISIFWTIAMQQYLASISSYQLAMQQSDSLKIEKKKTIQINRVIADYGS